MPKLVLYGIRLLAKQFLGTFLDIEVDHSDYHPETDTHYYYVPLVCGSREED